ncbi:hypothetical protein BJX76DRAFT_349221 [Aspergillus varians]
MIVLAIVVFVMIVASIAKQSMARPRPRKPIIVFVPGAWHTPGAHDLLLLRLHAAGYRTTSVNLPTVGATGPVSFADDVSAIRRVVSGLVDLEEDVFVVSPSYGDHPVTEALMSLAKKDRLVKGRSGGVIQLLYNAAIVPTKGISSAEAFGPMTPNETGGTWMIINDLGNGYTSLTNGEEALSHDLPPNLAKYHASLLRTQFQLYDDRAFPIERRRNVVKSDGIQRTMSLNTSHSPFLSDPEGVVDFIIELVKERPSMSR